MIDPRGSDTARQKGARVLAWLALTVAGCGSVTVRVGVRASGTECQRDFGSSTAAAKIETFLVTTAALERAVAEHEAALSGACDAMAREAGLPADPTPTLDTCRGLLGWLDTERRALDAATESDAPACSLSIDGYVQCVASCELRYRPSEVEVECAGTLEGRSCSEGLGSPQAGPRCRASCGTRAELEASCRVGGARLAVSGANTGERAARLAALWERYGPTLRLSRTRLERIGEAASQLLAIAPVLPEAAATVSIRAVACTTDAAGAAASAAAHLEVSRDLARRLAPDPAGSDGPQLR